MTFLMKKNDLYRKDCTFSSFSLMLILVDITSIALQQISLSQAEEIILTERESIVRARFYIKILPYSNALRTWNSMLLSAELVRLAEITGQGPFMCSNPSPLNGCFFFWADIYSASSALLTWWTYMIYK